MASYFVDFTGGDEANSGLSALLPVKYFAGMPSSTSGISLAAGDSMNGKRGETWREQLTVPSAGSAGNVITFGAYGSGNRPKILGSTAAGSWTEEAQSAGANIQNEQDWLYGLYAGASLTVSYVNTPTEGNLLLAWVSSTTNSITNASIPGWTLAQSAQTGSTTYIGLFYKVAGAAESKDVVLTWTGSTGTNMSIAEYSGLYTSNVLDQIAKTDTTGGGVTSRSSGTTAETTVADELIISAFRIGNAVTAQSWSNSFVEEMAQAAGNLVMFVGSRVVAATGAYETTLSWTTSRVAGGFIATFKALTLDAATFYYTTAATDPLSVWFVNQDGTVNWGRKRALKGQLVQEYDWWFDDPNNRLYVYSATDPATTYDSVEIPTRNYCIYASTNKNYITISNIECAFNQAVDADVYASIFFDKSTAPIVEDCVCHHTGVLSADPSGNGIRFDNCNTGIIRRNTCYSTGRRGIAVFLNVADYIVDDTIIEYNTVYDTYHAGINVFISGDIAGSLDGTVIRYNHVYTDDDYNQGYATLLPVHGIAIYGSLAASSNRITNTEIYYNLVHHMAGDGSIVIDRKVNGANIYNNVCFGTSSGWAYGSGIRVSDALNTNVIIKNNIAVDTGGSSSRCLEVRDAAAVIDCENNLWYQSAGGTRVYVEVPTSTVYHFDDQAAYKAATGWDDTGLWEDPLFVDAAGGDFHLQAGSPCINAGVVIAGLTTDYAGNPIVGLPDIGAYEADQVPVSFTFTDVTGADISTQYTSNTITVTGIDTAASITIVGGTYSKNGAAYTANAGTVVATDQVSVRVTSSGSFSTAVNVVLTIGGVEDTYTVTTKAGGSGRTVTSRMLFRLRR